MPKNSLWRHVFDASSSSAQASTVAGGKEAFCQELLPQLLPLLTCPAMLRSAYGASMAPDR